MKPAWPRAVRSLSLILAVTVPLTVSFSAQSAPTEYYSYNLPLDLALEAAQEAVRTCEASGYRVTATVVDMAGTPKVVLRGDRSTVHRASPVSARPSP